MSSPHIIISLYHYIIITLYHYIIISLYHYNIRAPQGAIGSKPIFTYKCVALRGLLWGSCGPRRWGCCPPPPPLGCKARSLCWACCGVDCHPTHQAPQSSWPLGGVASGTRCNHPKSAAGKHPNSCNSDPHMGPLWHPIAGLRDI